MWNKLGMLAALALLCLSTPRAAAAEPPPLEAYTRPPTLELVSLSASGDRLAFIADDHGVRKVYAREVGGPILMAAPVTAGQALSLTWAGENIVLVRLGNRGHGNVRFDHFVASSTVFAIDLEHRTVTRLLKNSTAYSPFFYGVSQVDGRWYGYFGGNYLFKIDLQTGKSTAVDGDNPHVSGWLISANGALLARSRYFDKQGHWSVTLGASDQVLTDGDEPYGVVGIAGEGRRSGTILVSRPGGDGFNTLFEVAANAPGPGEPLTHGVEVDGFWCDPDTHLLLGYHYDDGAPHDVLFDPALQRRVNAAHNAFPGLAANLVSTSRGLRRMIVWTDGGDDSGSYWLVDVDTGKASFLGARYPSIGSEQTGPVRLFQYKASDGLPLTGVLTAPPGRVAKNLPLIVLTHGGPEQRDYVGFDWRAQLFASRGYAVFQPDYRGSGDLGRTFRDAGFGQWGRRMQTDVSDGVVALAAEGLVDPRRVCVMGEDYGGYVALAGVTLQQGVYRCAVSLGAMSDLRDLLFWKDADRGTRSLSTRYWRKFIGADDADARLDDRSPVKHADRADAPILLLHTQDDDLVSIDQSDVMERALRRANKPVEVVTLKGSMSVTLETDTRNSVYSAILAFLLKHNPPD